MLKYRYICPECGEEEIVDCTSIYHARTLFVPCTMCTGFNPPMSHAKDAPEPHCKFIGPVGDDYEEPEEGKCPLCGLLNSNLVRVASRSLHVCKGGCSKQFESLLDEALKKHQKGAGEQILDELASLFPHAKELGDCDAADFKDHACEIMDLILRAREVTEEEDRS
jgi:transcription elongation factor Elf1